MMWVFIGVDYAYLSRSSKTSCTMGTPVTCTCTLTGFNHTLPFQGLSQHF